MHWCPRPLDWGAVAAPGLGWVGLVALLAPQVLGLVTQDLEEEVPLRGLEFLGQCFPQSTRSLEPHWSPLRYTCHVLGPHWREGLCPFVAEVSAQHPHNSQGPQIVETTMSLN